MTESLFDNAATPTDEQWRQAFQRVGEFMFHWASLENAINNFVAKAMNLGTLESVIVCSNLQFRDKTHIMATAWEMEAGGNKAKQKENKKLLKQLRGLTEDRNIVAHQFFAPSDDGIEFFIKKAKGRLSFPKTVWSNDDCEDKLNAIDDLAKIIRGRIHPFHRGLFGRLGASYGSYATTPNTGLLNLPSLEQLLTPVDQGDPESNRQPDHGKHPSQAASDQGQDPLAGALRNQKRKDRKRPKGKAD